jgi:hypothetical protein
MIYIRSISMVLSVTIIVQVLLRVFDRVTGLNPFQVESSSSSIRGGKGEALPGGQGCKPKLTEWKTGIFLGLRRGR